MERDIIGMRRGSGFTRPTSIMARKIGRTPTSSMHARHVSPEAQDWRGYYYGVNALKPCLEPILLAQKPISTDRVVDNMRLWGTGALNIGALQDRYGVWPRTFSAIARRRRPTTSPEHPSVKPVPLMEDICTLICPGGGRILDPFAGTGTTGSSRSQQGL